MEVLRSLSSWNPYAMDDAELLKDLRGLGKPPLFDGNDTDVSSSLCLKTIRSFCVTWMTWWCESRRTPQSHRRNGQPDEPAHRDAPESVH